MSTTAIILRDPNAKPIHVLECDGPNPHVDPIINYSPRSNLPIMSFEEWLALPDHVRNPPYRNPSNYDHESACRISRLIENAQYQGKLSTRHIIEIQSRLELLFPGCTDDILPTQPNLQSA